MSILLRRFFQWTLILVISTSFVPNAIGQLQAQHGGGERNVADPITIGNTNSAVRTLNSGRRECANLPVVYRIGCLRQVYAKATVPLKNPEYAGARKELNSTSRSLKKLVNKNVDKSAPIIKVGNRKYKAVKEAVVSSVNAEAKKIIGESATRLLRSGSKSKKRKVHYTKIAKAFDSTKVILRS